MKLNMNFKNIQDSYLFLNIAEKVSAYTEAHPDNQLIRMGIGDVTRPLAPAVIEAMHRATEEMSTKEAFRGYPSAYGETFLRTAIQDYYQERGVKLSLDEIFVSDGAKSDTGNLVDLFDVNNDVLIPDPVYPVYVDTNTMSGRKVKFIAGTAENNFLPLPQPGMKADIIYLCSPNNPAGSVYSKEQLKAWVDFALENQAVILFDAAYESFITDAALPHSIFEIPGAELCAIEVASFSKMAGFTGVRCGFTIISKKMSFDGFSVNKLWARRQSTKFNGVSYITQRGAQAVFSAEGREQIRETIAYYLENASIMVKAFTEMGAWFVGGKNSPYIWLRCPDGMTSWEFFDDLLEKVEVVGTPGSGFGQNGEGYFRLSAFGDRDQTIEAMERIKKQYKF